MALLFGKIGIPCQGLQICGQSTSYEQNVGLFILKVAFFGNRLSLLLQFSSSVVVFIFFKII